MSQDSKLGKGRRLVDKDQSLSSNIFLRVLPYLIILAAVLFFFYKLVFSNLILARGDTFLYFYPYWNAAAEALKSTHLPLWNNSLFMGAPFLANSQAGIFYPLNWPLWLTLPTPDAVKGSIILHLVIAAWGTYLVARRCLSLNRASSVLAAVLFALGGYLTAQVEHINQLQGLAWLPWYFVAACRWRVSKEDLRNTAKFIAIVAVLITLQLLAGHTQTVFISLFGLLIWIVSTSFKDGRWGLRGSVVGVLVLLAAVLLALLISGIQVAPTAELLMHSSRQGGFTPREALSFSLHPLILTRSLLPQYSGSLFSEYAAFLPISALLLAVAGAWSWRSDRQIRALFFVSLVGFLFALGMFNPIYQLLVRVPGFDLFRVPARWLALYAFGVALLAGAGIEALLRPEEDRGRAKVFVVGLLAIIALFGWGILSAYLSSYIDVGSEITAESPSSWTWVLWIAELAIAACIIFIIPESRSKVAFSAILVVILVVQFAFSRTLSYNQPTTPEAFSDYRPPSARIAANSQCVTDDSPCSLPPGRVLSLSDIFFDPGDQAEIDSAYSDFLPESALYDYTIAIKQKEIIAPDLPMIYGIQSVDGFDGGLLPLIDYTELMSLILPEDSAAVDGRLREYLSEIPEARWMDLFNARYLITDKVGDEWRDGVFFDKQHQVTLDSRNPTIGVGYVPDFMSTELWFIADDSQGVIEVAYEDGFQERLNPERIGKDLHRVGWSEPAALSSISQSQQPCHPLRLWLAHLRTMIRKNVTNLGR
jgi:hypothetical protein